MRALVISGGANKGSWSAGVIKHLLYDLEIKYDALCGVSAGALNCAFLAMFKHGEEKAAALQLEEVWNNIDTSKVYKRHFPFGKLHALWGQSFYDSTPLQELLRNGLDLKKIRESGKIVTAGTVSLTSGKYTIFDQTSDHFIDAVIASSAFPGMLSPISFLGQLWTDGGLKEISPVKKAFELGADTIDVIVTSPKQRINKFFKKPSIIEIMTRALDVSTDKISSNDLEKVEIYNQLALAGINDRKYVKVNIIRPDHNLVEDILDFSPIKIKEMMLKGYYDAKSKFIL